MVAESGDVTVRPKSGAGGLKHSPSLLFDILTEGDAAKVNQKLGKVAAAAAAAAASAGGKAAGTASVPSKPQKPAKAAGQQPAPATPAVAAAAAANGGSGAALPATAAGSPPLAQQQPSTASLSLPQQPSSVPGPAPAALLSLTPATILRELLGDLYIDPSDLTDGGDFGEGGFATVRRCTLRDRDGLQHVVAVKVLKPEMFRGLEDLRDFLAEANLLRKLRHKNIVRIRGIGAYRLETLDAARQSMFVVMEAMDSGTLRMMVIRQMTSSKGNVYSPGDALQWAIQIASSMSYLHHTCKPMIIHRDLKLENVLLNGSGSMDTRVAKLSDFGLHKRAFYSQDRQQLLPVGGGWRSGGSAAPSVGPSMHGEASMLQQQGVERSYYGGQAYYHNDKSVAARSTFFTSTALALNNLNLSLHDGRAALQGNNSNHGSTHGGQRSGRSVHGGGAWAGGSVHGATPAAVAEWSVHNAQRYGVATPVGTLLARALTAHGASLEASQLDAAGLVVQAGTGTPQAGSTAVTALQGQQQQAQAPVTAVPTRSTGAAGAAAAAAALADKHPDSPFATLPLTSLNSEDLQPASSNRATSAAGTTASAAGGASGAKPVGSHGMVQSSSLTLIAVQPSDPSYPALTAAALSTEPKLLAASEPPAPETGSASAKTIPGGSGAVPPLTLEERIAVEASVRPFMQQEAGGAPLAMHEASVHRKMMALLALEREVTLEQQQQQQQSMAIGDDTTTTSASAPSPSQQPQQQQALQLGPATSTGQLQHGSSGSGSLIPCVGSKGKDLQALSEDGTGFGAGGGLNFMKVIPEHTRMSLDYHAGPQGTEQPVASSGAAVAAASPTIHEDGRASAAAAPASTSASCATQASSGALDNITGASSSTAARRPLHGSGSGSGRARGAGSSDKSSGSGKAAPAAPKAGLAAAVSASPAGQLPSALSAPTGAKFKDATTQVGSLMYMAPELFGSHEYNEKVDVFSFGVMLFELFSGKLLVFTPELAAGDQDTFERYAVARSKGAREPLPSRWPPELKSLVSECWAQDPSQRPGFGQILVRLEQMQSSRVLDGMSGKGRKAAAGSSKASGGSGAGSGSSVAPRQGGGGCRCM